MTLRTTGEDLGHRPGRYPPYITTADERKRWDLAAGIAESIFDGEGPAVTWLATRAIFSSPYPTGELPGRRG